MDDRERRNQISVPVAFAIFASGLFLWLFDSDSPLRPLGLPREAAYAWAAVSLAAFWWVCVRRPAP